MIMAKNENHHLYKRGKVWYFQKWIDGKLVKKKLSTSVVEARTLRNALLKEPPTDPEVSEPPAEELKLFGQVAQRWAKIKEKQVRASTFRDYRSTMNHYVLPKFGNVPITEIGYIEVEEFITGLSCSAKRKNNVLVPMRSIFRFAHKAGLIDKNPMELVDNIRVPKPDIHPLSMEEITRFLDCVSWRYKNFFVVAFFTGMRFGEMAALKWKNVDFKLGVIKVRETRVMGEEGPPKTRRSVRDVKMLPPVVEALRDQRKQTMGRSDYVFLNQYGRPLVSDSVNFHAWKKGLEKAGLPERTLYQTRHTFATLMLDAGELPGWVQGMMGHESLQMIHDRYYSHIKNYERDDGSAFMEKVYKAADKGSEAGVNVKKVTTKPTTIKKRESGAVPNSPESLKNKICQCGAEGGI